MPIHVGFPMHKRATHAHEAKPHNSYGRIVGDTCRVNLKGYFERHRQPRGAWLVSPRSGSDAGRMPTPMRPAALASALVRTSGGDNSCVALRSGAEAAVYRSGKRDSNSRPRPRQEREADLFGAGLLAAMKYAQERGAVEFEPTDSASQKLLYVHRLYVGSGLASETRSMRILLA